MISMGIVYMADPRNRGRQWVVTHMDYGFSLVGGPSLFGSKYHGSLGACGGKVFGLVRGLVYLAAKAASNCALNFSAR